jgi:hypothetical protein
MNMKMKPLFTLCVLALSLTAQSAFALSTYRSRVPNGTMFSCNTCHDLVTGAPDLNPFGNDFLNNGLVWNAAVAGLDSDGDGAKNGTELGDPTGSGTPTPGAEVTNPGDPTSKPSATAPSITTQPASQTVTAGANVTFTVAASGTAPLSYQWRKNGGNIAGATGTSLGLSSVTSANAGSYTVQVSNSAGSATSATATLTVNPAPVAPSITTQPVSRTVTAGANVTFTVAASGTAPLSYQWRKNGGNIAGATGTSLGLSSVTSADAASYTVQVSNSAGSATSATATLTVNPLVTVPSITTQPASQTVSAGANVTFTVAVSGTAPLSYQWRKNGSDIAGATAAALGLSSVTSANAGSYTVRVSNAAGSILSTTATLTVNPAPVVLSVTLVSPTNGAAFVSPANVELTAAVSSSSDIVAVDFIDGTNLCGIVTAAPWSMAASNLSVGEHILSAMVTDSQGASVLSAPVTITVTVGSAPPPPPSTGPAVEMVTPENGAVFTAPARIILSARVADADHRVRRVDFFCGSTRLGTGVRFSEREDDHEENGDSQDGTLYVLVWSRVPAGSYTFRAEARYGDGGGATVTSAPVSVMVRRGSGWVHSRDRESDR